MKRILFLATAILFGLTVFAQEYEPTTTWPYLYPDFLEGQLQTVSGTPRKGRFNVHILHGKLHFIDGELIREASLSEGFSVSVGKDVHINAGGTMMKVLAKSDAGLVALETTVDMARLNATGGAYGSSSNSIATQSLSSLESATSLAGSNHMMQKNSKNDGKILPLNTKLYLVFGSKVVYAGKRDILKIDGIDKNRVNAFIKEHKIKWKEPDSLILLVDFLAEQTK